MNFDLDVVVVFLVVFVCFVLCYFFPTAHLQELFGSRRLYERMVRNQYRKRGPCHAAKAKAKSKARGQAQPKPRQRAKFQPAAEPKSWGQ